MKASIVIASAANRCSLRRTLECVFAQEYDPSEYEIVLVLDGSEPPHWIGREQRQQKTCLQVVGRGKSGQAASINAGIQAARGEFIIFLDDDITCGADFVARHVEAHQGKEPCLVFGPITTSRESADNLATEWILRHCDDWFLSRPDDLGRGWFFSFANPNTSAARSLLVAAGGLDESFARYNDTEFGFRLWKQGVRFRYLPEAPVEHLVRKGMRDLVREAYEEGGAEVRLCRKHPEYRRFSTLGGLSSGATRSIVGRRLLTRTAPLTEAILNLVCQAANRFGSSAVARRAGVRLLNWRRCAAFFRGAVEECGSRRRFSDEFGRRLVVLNFHRVGDVSRDEWWGLTLSARRFASCLNWLNRRGWKTITTADWMDWVERARPLPEKPLLITFDDGYKCNIKKIVPLLKQYDYAALTAVVTHRVGKSNEWDRESGLPGFPLMDENDIVSCLASGMEFASHSRTHPHLCTLPQDKLADEIAGSKADLEGILQGHASTFIYPYGESDGRVREFVSRHYRLAFSTEGGLNGLGDDRCAYKRWVVSRHDTGLDFWFVTRLGWSPLRRLHTSFDRNRELSWQVVRNICERSCGALRALNAVWHYGTSGRH